MHILNSKNKIRLDKKMNIAFTRKAKIRFCANLRLSFRLLVYSLYCNFVAVSLNDRCLTFAQNIDCWYSSDKEEET